MDKENFLKAITDIGTCEDEADRLTLLNSLRDEICGVFDNNDELTVQNNNYVEQNEKLRAANMDLFLQLGEQKSSLELSKDETGHDPEPVRREFKNLFNEKGEIK